MQRLTKEILDHQDAHKRLVKAKLDAIKAILDTLNPVANKLKELYPDLLITINKITDSIKE
jgi:hypothetical protein